jgi:hypothetical protein
MAGILMPTLVLAEPSPCSITCRMADSGTNTGL